MKTLLLAWAAFVSGPVACSAFGNETHPWSLVSPDGKLSVVVTLTQPAGPDSSKAGLSYRIQREGQEVSPDAPLGIMLKRLGRFQGELRYVSQSTRTIDERYVMPVGKRSRCHNRAMELTLDFANAADARLSLVFRAYDDGIAYCYRIHGAGQETIIGESSSFVIPPGSRGWFSRYTAAHYESDYDHHEELAVANLWRNRLVGDAGLSENKRLTKSNVRLDKDASLLASGLLGPATLHGTVFLLSSRDALYLLRDDVRRTVFAFQELVGLGIVHEPLGLGIEMHAAAELGGDLGQVADGR